MAQTFTIPVDRSTADNITAHYKLQKEFIDTLISSDIRFRINYRQTVQAIEDSRDKVRLIPLSADNLAKILLEFPHNIELVKNFLRTRKSEYYPERQRIIDVILSKTDLNDTTDCKKLTRKLIEEALTMTQVKAIIL